MYRSCHQETEYLFEHRERIVRAFEDETEDYLLVADTLGVNRSSARSIVARYIREGRINERPRGGVNNIRVDEEMRDCLDDIINKNCLLTLSRINHELRTRVPTTVNQESMTGLSQEPSTACSSGLNW